MDVHKQITFETDRDNQIINSKSIPLILVLNVTSD